MNFDHSDSQFPPLEYHLDHKTLEMVTCENLLQGFWWCVHILVMGPVDLALQSPFLFFEW